MKTVPQKCVDINSVGSFCGCIAGSESADPAAEALCARAKTDTTVTGDDLKELKSALKDLDDESCCDCGC